jgi:hypothetical protein
VGKKISVPGSWWNGMSEEDRQKTYECIVVWYDAKHQYAKGENQGWWIRPVYEDELYVCGYYHIAHFASAADRPFDYVASDDEDCDRGYISDSDACDTDDTDDGDPPAKKKKKLNKRKEPRQKSSAAKVSEGHFGYAVPIDQLPDDEADIRRTVEAHAGVYKKTLPAGHANAGKAGYLVEPQGWVSAPADNIEPLEECTEDGGIRLRRRFSAQEAQALTILDSWKLCHPKEARDCAVKYTQLYYTVADQMGKKATASGSKWPEGGFAEMHYIGYCAVLLFMGMIHVPNMDFYWNTDAKAEFRTLRSVMPRDTFWLFRRMLHFSDPRTKVGRGDYSQPPPPGYDVLYNWRKMQEAFNGAWSSLVTLSKWLAFDEMMIKLAMDSSLQRRQPNKPIRDGVQAYAVCCGRE